MIIRIPGRRQVTLDRGDSMSWTNAFVFILNTVLSGFLSRVRRSETFFHGVIILSDPCIPGFAGLCRC